MSGPFAAIIAAADESEGNQSEARSDRHVQVPISHPRYEKKTRLTRAMTTTVSDSASEHNGRSPADLLTMRSEEVLHIRQGPVSHKETVSYQAFACYKHGSKKVHTQSVGYSSDGDLVLMRRDVADVGSSGPNSLRRSFLGVDSAVCLNRNARPTDPQLAFDITGTKWERRMRTLKKYPGVKCPRSKKLQNRLNNDHFLNAAARKIHTTAFEDSDPEGLHQPADPVFGPVPDELGWLLNTEEELQRAELEKRGLNILGFSSVGGGGRAPKNPPKSVDSATYRFTQLNGRFKSELQHAMTTDFMPGFIAEVELLAERLIVDDANAPADAPADAPPPATSFDYACRDGYGRLITHAIAAFYRLNSKSVETADGQRVTQVALPKKRPMLPDQRLSAFLRGERIASSASKQRPEPVESSGSETDREEEAQNRLLARRRRFKKRVLRRRLDFYPPQESPATVSTPV